MRRRRHIPVAILAALTAVAALAPAAAAPAAPRTFNYDTPVLATSPWPQMRRDSRNTGRSPLRATYHRGDRPWSFHTRRGVFSTPVIGGDETVYVGSADGNFYAIGRRGRELWRLETGGIIDAAAALGRYSRRRGTFPITIGSGDEILYQLRGDRRRLSRERRIVWRFKARRPPATGQLVNWWEGNVAYGRDGNIYVGNTGGGAYSFTPRGRQRWLHQRGNSVWTTPAFDDEGNTYWGSVDLYAFSLDRRGEQRWQKIFLGYVTSSPALGSDGTVYVGAFDGSLHALDPDSGTERWSFATAEHIYSSPALGQGPDGSTRAIYIGSADGSLYAVRPDGTKIWQYDTGDPIRSSPVVGRAPRGGGDIVYVGSSNGKLYAIDAETGRRRWSFDTTPARPALQDRNDLNGSPALGRRGVYIAGEHGFVWFVPYDWCLRRRDPRCSRAAGQELGGSDFSRIFAVTAGGTTQRQPRRAVAPATVFGTRLIVREDGRTRDARILGVPTSDALVTSNPPFDFETQLSGDGRYLFVRPDGFLRPGTDYRVRVRGNWAEAGLPPGAGSFDDTLTFRTTRSRGPLRLRVGRRRTSALVIRRLALPHPPLLPSVNQIGFDSYDLIAGTLLKTKPNDAGVGRLLVWVVEGRRNRRGLTVANPRGNFAFPLVGTYKRDFVMLNASQVNLQFSFGPVPVRSLDFRGQLGRAGHFLPGASIYGQVSCASVPNYGAYLYVAGVCNPSDTLAASGTFLSDRYDARGGASRRPAGVSAGRVALQPPTATEDGFAVARLRLAPGARYPARRHLGSILLIDRRTAKPVSLDYQANTTNLRDRRGNIRAIRLRIPAATLLPADIEAWVIADVFPLARRGL